MRRTRHGSAIAIIVTGLLAAVVAGAQSKPAAGPADWGQWESLVPQGRAGLSPDGRWLAYGINRSDRQNELRVTNVAGGATTVAAFGSQPTFSANSKWLAYAIGYAEAEEEKLRQQKKPIHRKLGLLDLASGKKTTIDGVETFAFNASGTHLAVRRDPPERQGQPAEASASEETGSPGATVIVRELATGRDTTCGNVSEYAWQHKRPQKTT